MDCHGAGAVIETPPAGVGEIILVGNHNVGKSVLFGWLTGRYVTVANYPGTTVEITRGIAARDSHRVIVDTPGVNSLQPLSDDERVTRDLLLSTAPSAVVQVADAKNLRRALLITSQLADMQVPLVLVLNMIDEAHARQIAVDTETLSARIGARVLATSATKRQGLDALGAALQAPAAVQPLVRFDDEIENTLDGLEKNLRGVCARPRGIALNFLNGDPAYDEFVQVRVKAETYAQMCGLRDELRQRASPPPFRADAKRAYPLD